MSNDAVKKQILVVEDDEQSTRYIQVLLANTYAVRNATWAEAAWRILQENHIDLVLMDISLPGEENGLELTRRIRASEQLHALPVIAVTAHAFPRDRENSLAAGCNEYISKPFERGLLLTTVQRYLS
ncbi:MAG: response regulator [Bacteroidetes bacterium]|nr:response regulator [Bacteroidota bacterium]